MATSLIWRVLIVDDQQGQDVVDLISEGVFPEGDGVDCEICEQFDQARPRLEAQRVDLMVLDLRDDSVELEDDGNLPGLNVFEQIRDLRFVPVIFFTAYPQYLDNVENPFVRVISRDKPRELRTAIQEVLSTGLPHLERHLEEERRKYMWEFVEKHWNEIAASTAKTDLTFLLARRLANLLSRDGIRRFLENHGHMTPAAGDHSKIYPIEMYVIPPTSPVIAAGDLFATSIGDRQGYWLVLTPSCDFAQGKVENALVAQCKPLRNMGEYSKYFGDYIDQGKSPSKGATNELHAIIRNNRKKQPERFRFLPGTFEFPDLVADFQDLTPIEPGQLDASHRVASLDSPFAEALLGSFARYYGRMGTPDLDPEMIVARLAETHRAAE